MDEPGDIEVQVVFAAEHKQKSILLSVPQFTTAWQAVELSGITKHFPEFDFSAAPIGIYGKMVPRTHLLSNHDRVEIYRKLAQTPTTARRIRARKSSAS